MAVGLSGRQETPHCRRISLQQRSPPALTLVLLLLVVVPSSNVQRNRVRTLVQVLLLCYEIYCQQWFSPEKRTSPAPVLCRQARISREAAAMSQQATASLSSRNRQTRTDSIRKKQPPAKGPGERQPFPSTVTTPLEPRDWDLDAIPAPSLGSPLLALSAVGTDALPYLCKVSIRIL